MASEVHLPKTAAVADRSDGDERTDHKAFEQALRSELASSRIPLERFLVDGGWPTDAVIRVVDATVDSQSLRLTLAVTFDELVTACGGSPDSRPRFGELAIMIDRATAIGDFE